VFIPRRISRRTLLKRSLKGLLVIGPLAQAATILPASAYYPCQIWKYVLKRAYCQGTTWVKVYWQVDYYDSNYDCGGRLIETYPNHPNCVDEEDMVSYANGLAISAELGYAGGDYGMLRARASAIGPWEMFGLWPLDPSNYTNTWAIQSWDTGLWVSTELGDSGSKYAMLRARANAIGPWEQYSLYELGGSLYAIQSRANGLFVSAELGYGGSYYGMLRARASAVGPWEQFYLDPSLTQP
jgi:hypothetical protein